MKLPDYLLMRGLLSPEAIAFAEATNALIKKLGIKGLDIEVLE